MRHDTFQKPIGTREIRRVTDANRIQGELWQGARPPTGRALRELGIDTLVLCAEEIQPPDTAFPGVRVIRAPLDDTWDLPATQFCLALAAAERVARDLSAGRRVLVTCAMGLNRSGLVSSLALHRLTGRSGAECAALVRTARPRALFNQHFGELLEILPRGRTTREETPWRS